MKFRLKKKRKKRECDEALDRDSQNLNMVTPLEKAVIGYTGPMTVADITLASWNEFFHEGGMLNQPAWLETHRLKKIMSGFSRLASYHEKVE